MTYYLQAGALIGIFSTAWVMDKWGRKAGVLYCAILGIIGTACSAAAVNVGMFIAFRFVTGLSSGFLSVCMFILSAVLFTCSNSTFQVLFLPLSLLHRASGGS